MIRMVQSTSERHAKTYFADALSKSDYYLDDQELKGRFRGRLAERIGIKGPASKEAFFSLCENRNPVTGQPLTPNTKATRTTGYDINFHCPKSVSILHFLSEDNHILSAFEASVFETMRDIEADSKTRVRKGGKNEDRATGELLWSEFVHQTARPVDDSLPDPHLHAHCFVFNATWDEQEKKVKAGQFRDIKRDMPFYQARFHKRLSDRLIALGYQIRRTDNSFEIEGVPKLVISLFSKRTDEIGRFAKEHGIQDAKKRDGLGARTRSRKQKGHSMKVLKIAWRKQILELGEPMNSNEAVRFGPKKEAKFQKTDRCVEHALQHCFERASVMSERRILETAYRYALGNENISLDQLTEGFKKDNRIIHVRHAERTLCTTKEVLSEEKRMVDLARQGKNKFRPLYVMPPPINLKGEQSLAAQHVLTTTHKVSIIRGAAGTGKTTMMKETVRLIENAGKKVFVVAPTAQASRGVLKEEGFEKASTVASFLADRKMQEELKDQVLWVDEGGLLGTRDMKDILEVVTKQNARLIIGGDTRQHASVVRGDALRILSTVAGIRSTEMTKINRQKDIQYRSAVEDLSKGDVAKGFEKLDAMGAIKSVDPTNPNEHLVDDYMKAVKKGKEALVISPTHKQGDEVTEAIRDRLREAGMIGKKEIKASRLTNKNLTEAEKSDWRNFKEGQVVQFSQNLSKIKRGSNWLVKSAEEGRVEIEDAGGKRMPLPLSHSGKFDVFDKTEIGLSRGDKIHITRNGYSKDKKRMNNGQTLEIKSVKNDGKVIARAANGKATYLLDSEFGHISHAHCITSYAAQGKTVDEVFISQPSSTFAATDARQFYVSVSRGREAAHIYTDDKQDLLHYASELGERQSALELVSKQPSHVDHILHLQKTQSRTNIRLPQREKLKAFENSKEMTYEPGL